MERVLERVIEQVSERDEGLADAEGYDQEYFLNSPKFGSVPIHSYFRMIFSLARVRMGRFGRVGTLLAH